MKGEEIIRILVVDDSSNDAEAIANMLRNGGHAVHATRIEDDEDLRGALGEHPWDMLLSKPRVPFLTATEALGIIANARIDLPLLLIADDSTNAEIVEILKSGARDAVHIANPSRLEHTVLREVEDLRKRRRQLQCERLLQEANARAQSLVDSSRDAIAYVHEGMHIYANQSYLGMFGYSDAIELEGLPIMDLVVPEDQGKFKTFLRTHVKGGADADSIQIHGRKSDKTPFEVTMEFSTASYEGESCTQIVIRDQSLSKELEKKLDDLSKQDLLTGVYNRQYFLEQLRGVVGKEKRHGAVLYVRPDNFRELRQNIGIAASDMILTEVASVLNNQLTTEKDFVARFESNIFTIVLHDIGPKKAEAIGNKMRDAVAAHIAEAGGKSVNITCSIGISLYSDAIRNPQEVITRSEKAYNHASEQGLGQVYLYNPGEEEMADRERIAAWEKRLKNALRSNSFRLLFQPVVSLRGDSHENYEVLLRMLAEDGSEIHPREFIPAAEQSGLMVAVDRWVLANSVKALAERRRAGHKTNFFVKLSGGALHDARLLPWLRDLLKAAKLEANTLTVEVSEAVAAHQIKAVTNLLTGLKQLHVRMALDHVGLAPNFSNVLKHCDADFVKLDGSIVAAMNRDATAKQTLQAISATAKDGGKLVIAEFVEDAQTLAALWTSGVDYIQGHFLQPPSTEMNFDFSSAG